MLERLARQCCGGEVEDLLPQGPLDHAHGQDRRPVCHRGAAQVSKVSLGPQASGDDYGRQYDVTGCAGIPDLRRHPRMPCGTGVVTSSQVFKCTRRLG